MLIFPQTKVIFAEKGKVIKKEHIKYQMNSEKFPLFLLKPNEIWPCYMSAPLPPSICKSYQKSH